LVADAATILQRLRKDQAGGAPRPSLTGKSVEQEVRELLTERGPIYSRLADLTVDTTLRTAEEVAEAITAGLGGKAPRAAGIVGRKEK
jgi:shikimate kinase